MHKSIRIIFIVLFLAFLQHQAAAQEVLTWEDCVKESAKNHPDLISAQEKVKQSEATKKVTASALYPQVSSDLSAQAAKAGGDKTRDTYAYGVTGTQLIFDGDKTGNEVKAAMEDIKAAQYNYQFVSTDVRLQLRTAFIDLLKAQELMRISEDIAKIRRSNLVSITLRYESGLEHKGALSTAQANLAEANYGISQAKRDFAVAQRELNKEMGRSELIPLTVKSDFNLTENFKDKPDFDSLVSNNPSLQKAIAQKNSAEFGLKSSWSEFFPTLSGQAGAGRNSGHWPPSDNEWNTGLTLSFPLFEGGSRIAQKDKAQALFKQLIADEKSTKDGLVLTLEQAWAALQDAAENVDVQKKFLDAAEERAKIAEAQYALGLIQFDNWTIIEDSLVSNKRTFLNAQANALLAEANWVQAKGETLEYAQ